jgi:hypothetical protein
MLIHKRGQLPVNKIFENESLFEEINAKMTKASSSLSPSSFPKDFVLDLYCECANKACQERVSIAYDEYKKAKSDNLAFVVKPEHYLPEFERVVRQTMNYWIILKRLEKMGKRFEV